MAIAKRSATATKRSVRSRKATIVDNSLRFSNGDVSLDEAVARNGGRLVLPKKLGIQFS